MSPKAGIALLVVIVLLFIVGVGCGQLHKDPKLNPGWADALVNVLVKKATADDLVLKAGACSRSGDSLTVLKGFDCTVQVVDRRRVNLTLTQGLSVTIRVTQNSVRGTQDPKSDQTYEFILDKPDPGKAVADQDQFNARCPITAPANCVLRVNG